ncbi:sigma-like protein [Streptomyces sp. NPDC048187]|uniref:sigma-like protein n=1 Tax=Streptomyces sp. NPDC048187 TaxID=3365509 RepID=UPI00372321FB
MSENQRTTETTATGEGATDETVTTLENPMPTPPKDGAVSTLENPMPGGPAKPDVRTMENPMPAPPALGLDGEGK